MMLRPFVVSLCLVAFTVRNSAAEAARMLSLDECIQLALRHNYALQINRLAPEIAGYNLDGSYGAYEPVFSFSAGHQYLDQPGGVDPKKTGFDAPYQASGETAGMGIKGTLPTGLQYGVQASATSLNYKADFSSLPGYTLIFPPYGIRNTNQFQSQATLTLDQPLLRNLWTDQNRETILVNKQNLKISEMALRWQIMNTIYAVHQAYFELGYAREKAHVEELALDMANRLLADIRRRVQAGELPPLEAEQAAAQAESVRTDLFAAQQNISQQQNSLIGLVTDDFRSWNGVSVDSGKTTPVLPGLFDRAESWRNAINGRPDLTEARLDLEKQGIIVRYRFNQVFPNLDLVGSYGVQGLEPTGEMALADVRDQSKPQYSFGVVLSIPLGGNLNARNNYKASQAAKRLAALRYKQLEQNILLQVDSALTQAQFAYKRTESSRQARAYAESALKAEQEKLRAGLSTPFQVLQYQQRLTAAHTAEIRSLADYQEAQAQLALDEGSILEKVHYHLEFEPRRPAERPVPPPPASVPHGVKSTAP
jgi:outer membrane protein